MSFGKILADFFLPEIVCHNRVTLPTSATCFTLIQRNSFGNGHNCSKMLTNIV